MQAPALASAALRIARRQSILPGMSAPITIADVRAARERLAPHLAATPLRQYPQLDAAFP